MSENKDRIPAGMCCSRQLYDKDLKYLKVKKQAEGYQLIVSGDFNSDYEELKYWMPDECLQDMIVYKHGESHIIYHRSVNDPLEYVCGSPLLHI